MEIAQGEGELPKVTRMASRDKRDASGQAKRTPAPTPPSWMQAVG